LTYSADYSREARNYLRKAPPADRGRLLARVELICEDPFNGNVSKPLQGRLDGTRSSRVGNFRIIFEVVQGELLVSVVKIGPRGDVYG